MSTALGPPEVFTVLCGLTTKSITDQVNTGNSFVRDCALPEDIPVRELILSGRQWDLRGSGQMNRTNFTVLDAAVGIIKNFRFFIKARTGEVAPQINGYYGGAAAITSRQINAPDADYTGVDLTITSHGPWVWTPVAIV
jgi:hypothetical protein